MIKKSDKQSFLYLGIVIVAAILVCVGSFYYFSQIPEMEEKSAEKKPTGKSMEEILRSLTASEGETEPVSKEVMESLTAPKSKKETPSVSEDVLEKLTAPE